MEEHYILDNKLNEECGVFGLFSKDNLMLQNLPIMHCLLFSTEDKKVPVLL